MNTGEGFVDLRLNTQKGQVNESFWPSFTDIMTVIVMIFLIAMVVLLMRNMELVRELRATMEAERVASELARATGEEKASLATQLHRAQDRISQLQLELMRLRESNLAQAATVTEQLTQITDLTAQRDRYSRQAASLHLLRQRLETELDDSSMQLNRARLRISSMESNIGELEQNLENLQSRFQQTQDTVSQLQQELVDRQQALESNKQLQQASDQRYTVLVGEYEELKTRYDKLVRPARSPQGRYLVEVRYWKRDGEYRISYREGDSGAFRSVSSTELDEELTQIAEQHGNGLYIKVIFPENSGLSYNEAWRFTTRLHNKFDYYYSNQPADSSEQADQEVE